MRKRESEQLTGVTHGKAKGETEGSKVSSINVHFSPLGELKPPGGGEACDTSLAAPSSPLSQDGEFERPSMRRSGQGKIFLPDDLPAQNTRGAGTDQIAEARGFGAEV
jgi:hypothetical protein